ncbi:unnamed protein product [Thelazia callipaeda]|uniref:Uncharacterized protein n=1 Tax=Thelazia callipaeda TaxID=103827 RepID=A0A0N5CYJ3_THECL|nr:unnamed protein product [Thelazia callipaeda]
MIESVGTKLFKSITKTADELGGRFEIAFTNFSDKITRDADVLVVQLTFLSNLISIVLCVLIVLLLIIIFKFFTLGVLYVRKNWYKRHLRVSKPHFLILATAITLDDEKMNSAIFTKSNTLQVAVQLQSILNDKANEFLVKSHKN